MFAKHIALLRGRRVMNRKWKGASTREMQQYNRFFAYLQLIFLGSCRENSSYLNSQPNN